MIFFQIGYQWFAVPDEHGDALYRVLAHVRLAEHQGYGKDARWAISDEPVDVSAKNVQASCIAKSPLSLPDIPPAPAPEGEEVAF